MLDAGLEARVETQRRQAISVFFFFFFFIQEILIQAVRSQRNAALINQRFQVTCNNKHRI